MNSLLKKFIAEIIGTFVLVFVACGTAGYTSGEPVATSLAFGLSIVAMAYSIGRISGCHINPAVSLGVLLAKKMTLKEFWVYIAGQLIGAICGALLVFGIFKMAGANVGNACNAIVDGLDNGHLTVGGTIGAILAEVVLTCIFVYVILNVTDSKNESVGKMAGIIIGLTLTLVHLVGIGLTGTSVNPARSIATAIASLIYEGNADALKQVWIFIVAPLVGGALAALLFNALHKEKDTAK